MKNKLMQALIFVMFLSLILKPNLITSEIINALNVFSNILFPSIFPFFLISDLLISYNFCNTLNKYFSKINNFLFHTSNASNFVIIMSIFSGFPSGAKYIRTLYDKKMLSINQANYLITFTHFANPLFVLTVTKVLFNNTSISYLILFCHIISNIIIAIIIRPKEKECFMELNNIKNESFSTNLSNSIKSSLKLLLLIFGNTCFFFIVTRLINDYFSLNIINQVFINGFFDMTKGINSISLINSNILFKAILVLTFISFGGINVHMQVLNIIGDTDIRYKNFLLGRISQLAISSVLFFVFYSFNTSFY